MTIQAVKQLRREAVEIQNLLRPYKECKWLFREYMRLEKACTIVCRYIEGQTATLIIPIELQTDVDHVMLIAGMW